MNRLGIKLLLTRPIVALLVWPFYDPRVQGGVFHDLQVLGPVGFALTALGFFALVYFYCRDLSRVVQLVSPAARAATPRSAASISTTSGRGRCMRRSRSAADSMVVTVRPWASK